MKKYIDNLSQIPDRALMYIIRHSNDFSWNFLAIKISLTRLNLKLSMYPEKEGIVSECCEELRNLLRKSAHVPNAQKDFMQILSISEQEVGN